MQLRVPILAALALTACRSVEFPPGSGAGVVTFDATPPPGAAVVTAPTWQRGDRFEFARGGGGSVGYTVVAADDAGYQLRSDDGRLLMRLAHDLSELGQEVPDVPTAAIRKDPGDALYHWPLWPGKRWTCEFLLKAPGRSALPLVVNYHCDAEEAVTTPAGTFRCLRIWRQLRLPGPDARGERTTVTWYAPQVGFFVRRLENDTLSELTRYQRAARADSAAR